MSKYENEFKDKYNTMNLCGDDHDRKDVPAFCEYLKIRLEKAQAKNKDLEGQIAELKKNQCDYPQDHDFI